jgi:hypothetical protein
MKKATSEGVLQFHIMCVRMFLLVILTRHSSAPKSRDELQELLKIVIHGALPPLYLCEHPLACLRAACGCCLTSSADEVALTDATQKLPRSLQALLAKLSQLDALPLSELVRCCVWWWRC